MKTTGYILNGVYIKGTDYEVASHPSQSSTYKEYTHDRQREEHRRDLLQPYKDGRLNEEFREQYPEEAKNYGFN